jgi:hypothetical protein
MREVIGILCAKRKARFRVVWVRCGYATQKMQAAIHRMDPDVGPCVAGPALRNRNEQQEPGHYGSSVQQTSRRQKY